MSDDPDIHHRTPIPAVKLVVNTQFGQVEVANGKFRRANESLNWGALKFSCWTDFIANAEVSSPLARYCKNGTFDVSDQLDSDWGTRVDTMDSTVFLNDL